MFSTYSRNHLGIAEVFNLFVPVDLPTYRWVNSPMVAVLLDVDTSLISLHNNPLNIPDISWTKGASPGNLCKHQGLIREGYFFP